MTPICNREKLNEGTDIKRIALLFVRKLWLVVIAVVVGVLFGAVIYVSYGKIVDGDPTYMSSRDYYISFNLEDYPDGMDYYNAYTWGQFVKDDKIINLVLAELPTGYEKQEIVSAVSSEMVSDYRVLTVQIKGKDKSRVEAVSKAFEVAIPKFADEVNELSSIELWSEDETVVIDKFNRTGNAAFLGGLIAFVLAMIVYAVYYVLDDRIYTEADYNRHFSEIPFIGYESEGYKKAFDANYAVFVGDREAVRCSDVTEQLETLKKSKACVLEIVWGKTCATQLRYDMDLLKKQSVEILGVTMKNCNEKFLKAYYGKNK